METPTKPEESYPPPFLWVAYTKFTEFGVPRLFSWVEWAGFIALLQFVGKKYDIPALLYAAPTLVIFFWLHMTTIIGNVAGDLSFNRKGAVGYGSILLFAVISGIGAVTIWFFINNLIDALITAQGKI